MPSNENNTAVKPPAYDQFYDEATPGDNSADLEINDYKVAKQEMKRLGFENLDEYFEYVDYMERKKSRASVKGKGMEM
jgi:GH35 family endo-1,4-beta-xylanase